MVTAVASLEKGWKNGSTAEPLVTDIHELQLLSVYKAFCNYIQLVDQYPD